MTSLIVPFNFIFVITSTFDRKGQSLVLRKLGPWVQLLSFKASAAIPRVPVSAGLFSVSTWYHSSTVVTSSISPTRLATNTGCFAVEWSHCSTVVMSVHIKTSFIGIESAFKMSILRRVASKEACSSNFGMEIAFIGATRALLKMKASFVSCVSIMRARRNPTAHKTSC